MWCVCVLWGRVVYARHPLCIVGFMWQRVGSLCLCPQPASMHSVVQQVTGILMAPSLRQHQHFRFSERLSWILLSFFLGLACRLKSDECPSFDCDADLLKDPPSANPTPKKQSNKKTSGWKRSLSHCYCWLTHNKSYK